MKRAIALSLSLVAFSGGAGLGLSILHDYSTPVRTAMLASPEIQSDASSGFVIPQHVPSAFKAATLTPKLHTPAPDADVISPELSTQSVAAVRPRVRSEAVAALAPVQAPVATLPSARQQVATRTDPYIKDRRAKARAVAPTGYVAQSFLADEGFAPKNGPDYIVGVYR